jgi:DNA end-binding protein Ku
MNKNTGHRNKYVKVDADTGEDVPNEDITKGFKVDADTSIEERTRERRGSAPTAPA